MGNRIKLSILGISYSQIQAGAYALVFAEENGIRRLPVVIGTPEAQSIAIHIENIPPPRPLSHDLMKSLLNLFGATLREVFIHKFEGGAFYSELLIEQNGEFFKLDSRTSDAVALAVRTGAPIYTTEEIMQKVGIIISEQNEKVHSENQQSVDKDFSMWDAKELKLALEKAIENENYEEASRIRDEINSRHGHS